MKTDKHGASCIFTSSDPMAGFVPADIYDEQRKAAKRRNRAVMLVVAVAVLFWGLV